MKAIQGSLKMMSRTALVIFLASLYLPFQCPAAEKLKVRAGSWILGGTPVSEIDSTLFTHLLFSEAYVKPSSFEVGIHPSFEPDFVTFSRKVKQKNRSVKTLLTIWGGPEYALMVRNLSSISSFIRSAQNIARTHGFDGVDLDLNYPITKAEKKGMESLLKEWRKYIHANDSELILTASVPDSPDWSYQDKNVSFYPIRSMATCLDWVHLQTSTYNFNESSYGINNWIHGGLTPSKIVLGLPFFGYAWSLTDPEKNKIGVPATGILRTDESEMMTFKEIRDVIPSCGGITRYSDTYKICYISCGSTWIAFDDDKTIKIKVSYAKEHKLRGYVAWQVSYDDNGLLSGAANGDSRLLEMIWWALAIISVLLLLRFLVYFLKRRMFKLKANEEAAEYLNGNAPDVKVFSLSEIDSATNRFSTENKIGEGGFGVVYKGILPNGEEIAVKRRSKGSKQGFKEFKNEAILNARLQHVNLVQLLGFCNDKEEQMLVYEYMPNKSLDFYLFDPTQQHLLDWKQRVYIIEGVTQGLIYLQEYSRLTIIHRDLKASNILLDHEMKPKISDFGMARSFEKDKHEERASKLVGTYGYIPPEYVEKGLCSIKSDVYSFGIILLQIISGKKISNLYGDNNDLNLLECAYVLWKEGKGMEFMDASLDDTSSPCKLMRCLQIALLCVQKNAKDRPSMLEAGLMLGNKSNVMAIPKQPAYSKVGNEDAEEFSQHPKSCSQNETTMSPVWAR